MPEIPNTRLINFMDTAALIRYDNAQEAVVPLDPGTGNIVDVTGFRRISVAIDTTSATSFFLQMGKISARTLAQAFSQRMDQKIHTFEVTGPEIVLILKGGQPGWEEKVRLWVYLRS